MFQYPHFVVRFLSYAHIPNCCISLASSLGLYHSLLLQFILQVTKAKMEAWGQGYGITVDTFT